MRRALPLILAACASAALLVAYLSAGGGTYEPLEVADPCEARPLEAADGGAEAVEQLTLSALDGAACALRVTREELALAIASEDARRRFAEEHRISDEQFEDAVRAGLRRAADDARRAGTISAIEAELLRSAVDRLPLEPLVRLLSSPVGGGLLDALTDLLGSAAQP